MSNVENKQKIGTLVGGSLSSGLEIRLDSEYSVENLYVGDGITIEGREKRYFGIRPLRDFINSQVQNLVDIYNRPIIYCANWLIKIISYSYVTFLGYPYRFLTSYYFLNTVIIEIIG